MNAVSARILLFVSGFLLWAIFSLLPDFELREGWDRAPYWSVGVPAILAVQAGLGIAAKDAPWRQPLFVMAGHIAAMILLHPPGTGLGLLPIAILFIGLPFYGALFLAAWAGRILGRFARR